MKKGWKIVIIIVIVALAFSALCAGVGIITGADLDTITTVIDERYHVKLVYDWVLEVIAALEEQLL